MTRISFFAASLILAGTAVTSLRVKADISELLKDFWANPSKRLTPITAPSQKNQPETSGVFFIDLSQGWNNNPQVTPTGLTNNPMGSQETQAKAGLEKKIVSLNFLKLDLAYYYSGTFFANQSLYDFDQHNVVLPISIYSESLRLKINPTYAFENYGLLPYSQEVGGSAEISIRWSQYRLGLGVQYLNIDNLTTNYSFETGPFRQYFIFAQVLKSNSRILMELASNSFQGVNFYWLAPSYQAQDLIFNFDQEVGSWDFSFNLAFEHRQYTQAELDLFARIDNRTTSDLQIGYSLSSRFRVYLDGTETLNQSNYSTLPVDYNYNQSSVLLGLTVQNDF